MSGGFPAAFAELGDNYEALIAISSREAGLCSQANARRHVITCGVAKKEARLRKDGRNGVI